jgi:quercetin dioxygenase-like cupin family protein
MESTFTDIDSRRGFSLMGVRVNVLAEAEETEASYEAIVQTVAPGGGSPPHTIAAGKVFFVLDGEVTISVDGDARRAPAGTVAHVPRGAVHNFRNEGSEPARLLVITTGDGHVDFLAGLARLAAAGPPDPAAVDAHSSAHGVRMAR